MQKAREESTQDLLDELSQLEKDTPWSGSQSIASSTTTSTPSTSKSTTPFETQRKRSNTDLSSNTGSAKVTENFQLPFFSPVIQECIKKDAFTLQVSEINLSKRPVRHCEVSAVRKGKQSQWKQSVNLLECYSN